MFLYRRISYDMYRLWMLKEYDAKFEGPQVTLDQPHSSVSYSPYLGARQPSIPNFTKHGC